VLQDIVARHTRTASGTCPSLKTKRATPHSLRDAADMALLHRGVDLTVIALWLGHESTEPTEMYLHADTRLKARALAQATPAGVTPRRFQAPDRLLASLKTL
jgi:integrase/recombinase XerD